MHNGSFKRTLYPCIPPSVIIEVLRELVDVCSDIAQQHDAAWVDLLFLAEFSKK